MTTAFPIFNEAQIAQMYDRGFSNLLNLWDGTPVQHAGYFDDPADADYRTAANRTSEILANEAGIDRSSQVLDAGCGTGDFVFYLSQEFGCHVAGIDLSSAHIRFARDQYRPRQSSAQFAVGSVSTLPCRDGSFTHVVSQDALYHVPDKPRSHAEMFRVLKPGGILAFCDFLQPTVNISDDARSHLHDRMMRGKGYSFVGYQMALSEAGFDIVLARNLSSHFRRSYILLARMAREHIERGTGAPTRRLLLAYLTSCIQIQDAIAQNEFGWGMFVARKPDAAQQHRRPSSRLIAALSGGR